MEQFSDTAFKDLHETILQPGKACALSTDTSMCQELLVSRSNDTVAVGLTQGFIFLMSYQKEKIRMGYANVSLIQAQSPDSANIRVMTTNMTRDLCRNEFY